MYIQIAPDTCHATCALNIPLLLPLLLLLLPLLLLLLPLLLLLLLLQPVVKVSAVEVEAKLKTRKVRHDVAQELH
jgi:hypothetical protein